MTSLVKASIVSQVQENPYVMSLYKIAQKDALTCH